MKADLRTSWTAYAEKCGLVRDAVPAPAPVNKYHAIPVHVDGVRFASKKEAARFLELRCWQKAGQIAELACQPVFPLHVMRLAYNETPIRVVRCGVYTADFSYLNLTSGEYVVEDVKSTATRTTAYRLRKRFAEVIHGITITEV